MESSNNKDEWEASKYKKCLTDSFRLPSVSSTGSLGWLSSPQGDTPWLQQMT